MAIPRSQSKLMKRKNEAADPRIAQYLTALTAMRQGKPGVTIPLDGTDDDVSRLGRALADLILAFQKQIWETERLAKVTQKINAGMTLDEVLRFVFDSFREELPYDRIGLALLEADGRIARSRWVSDDDTGAQLHEGYSAPIDGSSLGTILQRGEPRIINDLEAYLREHPFSESTRRIVEDGIRSNLTCPLIVQGKPVGFLFFSSRQPNTYRDVHQTLFMRIASQLSVIVEKSRIYQELVQTNRELTLARDVLAHKATRDALTELWNRDAILALLDRELSRSRRDLQPLTVAMMDVDHFKRINDTYGHLAGDTVLREMSRRVLSFVRAAEAVGRYGGEEFLIILYPCDEKTALHVMERIRVSVSKTEIETSVGNIQTTVSLGAAVSHRPAEVDATLLIQEADRALYRAKEKGRNQVDLVSVPGV